MPHKSEGKKVGSISQSTAMPSVDKALRALLTLADSGPTGLSLSDLANKLGINKSSLHVTLSALKYRGFVSQNYETGFYNLGSSIHALHTSYINSVDIIGTLRPAVRKLAQSLNEVCHISILDGSEILYMERIESRKPIQAGTSVGMRIPAINTAMGRIMIAYLYHEFSAFEATFGKSFESPTNNSPKSIEEAWGRIQEAKEKGYSLDIEENVSGVIAVSIAILEHKGPVAAVSVATLANDLPIDGLIAYEPILREALETVTPAPYHLSKPQP